MNRHNRYPMSIRVNKEEVAALLVMFDKTVFLQKPDHVTGLECLTTCHRLHRYRGEQQFIGIRDWLAEVSQAFKVSGDGLGGHLARVSQVPAPGNAPGQRGDQNRVAALGFGSQDDLVLHQL